MGQVLTSSSITPPGKQNVNPTGWTFQRVRGSSRTLAEIHVELDTALNSASDHDVVAMCGTRSTGSFRQGLESVDPKSIQYIPKESFAVTSVAFVPDPSAAEIVVEWTTALTADDGRVEYLCIDDSGAGDTELSVRAALDSDPSDAGSVSTISTPTPFAEILDRCRASKANTLVSDSFALNDRRGHLYTSVELIRSSPCRTFIKLFGRIRPQDVERILIIASRGAHDLTALRVADQLGRTLNAKVTVATVEYEAGEKAELAGERAIRSLIHDAALDIDRFEVKVVVDRLKHRGILNCADGHQLILVGRDSAKDVWPLRQSLQDTTVIVVKRSPPLSLRSWPDWFPKINPHDHAELVQDLRQGSRWASDFVGMLALASAIATLGLMQNSPAVVIGSMLLAPLMTPMIGVGLSLAQANMPGVKRCGKSILYGFLLTLVVSFLLGMITPSRETLSPEVLSRGTPNVLDLLIALFAAVAATFALARPNIAGAVAGVAIATALVPPVCAVGLSLSNGAFGNAVGAMLLFGTNLIAIIVASSFTFSLLGVSTNRALPRHRHTVRWGRWGLVALLVVLAGPLSFKLLSQLHEGRAQTAVYPVTRDLSRALHTRVARDPGVDIASLVRSSVMEAVVIHIATDHDLPRSYADELRAIVREQMEDEELSVFVIALRGDWRSDQDEGLSEKE
jgi:uncharacterized hydrophobic protein (TIGR00271 family)